LDRALTLTRRKIQPSFTHGKIQSAFPADCEDGSISIRLQMIISIISLALRRTLFVLAQIEHD
jgi:hypothetical protein